MRRPLMEAATGGGRVEPTVVAVFLFAAVGALFALHRFCSVRKRLAARVSKRQQDGSWRTLCTSSSVGVRSIVCTQSGVLLGCRVVGPRIIVLRSDNGGVNWAEQGVVTQATTGEALGDSTLLLTGATSMLCAFRIRTESGKPFAWQVVVCQSNDLGKNWASESVVDTSSGPFLGAPSLLLLSSSEDLLVVYDNEVEAKIAGYAGYQWLVLRRKALGDPAWSAPSWVLDPPTIASILKHQSVGLLRDGMASLVQLNAARGRAQPLSAPFGRTRADDAGEQVDQ